MMISVNTGLLILCLYAAWIDVGYGYQFLAFFNAFVGLVNFSFALRDIRALLRRHR